MAQKNLVITGIVIIGIVALSIAIVAIVKDVIKRLVSPKPKTLRLAPDLSKDELMELSRQERSMGKGGVNNWGDHQLMLIQYLISDSLLKTQTELSGKTMDMYEFIHAVNHCLTCITHNFATKYPFDDVVERMDKEGMDKNFDAWFRDLYTTCNCDDKLGQLLVKLLKEFWLEKSSLSCPDTKSQMAGCISRIEIHHFSQGMVDQVYKRLESCVEAHCPDILKG
jgi:hypothetical protein